MTGEEIGELLAAAAMLGDWVEATDFAHDGLYAVVMSEDLLATLSFDPESATLRTAVEVTALPHGPAAVRAEIMEVLLHANALSHHGDGVSFSLSPDDDTVTLLANLPAKVGGERLLESRLRRMATLVEAWRPLIASLGHGGTAPDEVGLESLLLFRA
ncbi:CesT family type III secretion system chaperone [Methylocystis echinoides]|uniref:Tir chaperone protein (CesT) family protein n=1 Tax=Methylocystis echinoides TaxID=29468 RepID=A0A9W6GR24_9HYPH|nr:CesT family type III secretion system chaperone [Methylocystis echinoides]GLI91517.1 hypothetical protein LMG27198_05090 [Methylocystis echinoides]